nr:hypothetical protein StreXyl84_23250 [Streptomyces sp. Xyl84]
MIPRGGRGAPGGHRTRTPRRTPVRDAALPVPPFPAGRLRTPLGRLRGQRRPAASRSVLLRSRPVLLHWTNLGLFMC